MKLRLTTILFSTVLFFTACSESSTAPKGHLMIIGGGTRSKEMMDLFFEYGGGKDKPYVIITTAANDPIEKIAVMTEDFHSRGVSEVRAVAPSRLEADDSVYVSSLLKDVQGIYFSGGSQYRIVDSLRNTLLHKKMMELYYDGGIIGGTSAGAGMMADPMIVRNHIDSKEIQVDFLKEDFVYVSEGMGFFDKAIIDQHFLKFKRANRAFTVALEYPEKPLLGVDESTAAVVSEGRKIEVIGESCVFIMEVDPKAVKKNQDGLLGTTGMTVRILLPGDKYQF